MSNSLQPRGLQPTRLLCPWDSPGKNTGVVARSFSRRYSRPRYRTQVSRVAGRRFCPLISLSSNRFGSLYCSLTPSYYKLPLLLRQKKYTVRSINFLKIHFAQWSLHAPLLIPHKVRSDHPPLKPTLPLFYEPQSRDSGHEILLHRMNFKEFNMSYDMKRKLQGFPSVTWT